MAKVVIKIKDKPDGKFNVAIEFDPPISDPDAPTPAQCAGAAAMLGIEKWAKKLDEEEG